MASPIAGTRSQKKKRSFFSFFTWWKKKNTKTKKSSSGNCSLTNSSTDHSDRSHDDGHMVICQAHSVGGRSLVPNKSSMMQRKRSFSLLRRHKSSAHVLHPPADDSSSSLASKIPAEFFNQRDSKQRSNRKGGKKQELKRKQMANTKDIQVVVAPLAIEKEISFQPDESIPEEAPVENGSLLQVQWNPLDGESLAAGETPNCNDVDVQQQEQQSAVAQESHEKDSPVEPMLLEGVQVPMVKSQDSQDDQLERKEQPTCRNATAGAGEQCQEIVITPQQDLYQQEQEETTSSVVSHTNKRKDLQWNPLEDENESLPADTLNCDARLKPKEQHSDQQDSQKEPAEPTLVVDQEGKVPIGDSGDSQNDQLQREIVITPRQDACVEEDDQTNENEQEQNQGSDYQLDKAIPLMPTKSFSEKKENIADALEEVMAKLAQLQNTAPDYVPSLEIGEDSDESSEQTLDDQVKRNKKRRKRALKKNLNRLQHITLELTAVADSTKSSPRATSKPPPSRPLSAAVQSLKKPQQGDKVSTKKISRLVGEDFSGRSQRTLDRIVEQQNSSEEPKLSKNLLKEKPRPTRMKKRRGVVSQRNLARTPKSRPSAKQEISVPARSFSSQTLQNHRRGADRRRYLQHSGSRSRQSLSKRSLGSQSTLLSWTQLPDEDILNPKFWQLGIVLGKSCLKNNSETSKLQSQQKCVGWSTMRLVRVISPPPHMSVFLEVAKDSLWWSEQCIQERINKDAETVEENTFAMDYAEDCQAAYQLVAEKALGSADPSKEELRELLTPTILKGVQTGYRGLERGGVLGGLSRSIDSVQSVLKHSDNTGLEKLAELAIASSKVDRLWAEAIALGDAQSC